MSDLPDKVELHFNRDGNLTAYLVIVPDGALTLAENTALSRLIASFNGGATKSARLFALAEAVKAAEEMKIVAKTTLSQRFARAVVACIYPVVSKIKSWRAKTPHA